MTNFIVEQKLKRKFPRVYMKNQESRIESREHRTKLKERRAVSRKFLEAQKILGFLHLDYLTKNKKKKKKKKGRKGKEQEKESRTRNEEEFRPGFLFPAFYASILLCAWMFAVWCMVSGVRSFWFALVVDRRTMYRIQNSGSFYSFYTLYVESWDLWEVSCRKADITLSASNHV